MVSIAMAPEWIVCDRSARSVVDGIVACPHGIFSQWGHCLGCRFLESTDGDREPERSCFVESWAPPEPPRESRNATSAGLMIELL